MILTILYVTSLARAREFYDAVFGWTKSVDVPVYIEYEVNPGARLGLMPQANTAHFLGEELGTLRPIDGCPRAEIYVRVDHARPILDRLDELETQCLSPWSKRDWGDFAAYYQDADDYIIAIAQPII